MAYRLVGANAFGFGLNWEKVPGEEPIAREVLVYLENRRILFGYRHSEEELYCVASANEMRGLLTERISRTKPKSSLCKSLRELRRACTEFVENAGPNAVNYRRQGWDIAPTFSAALHRLRERVAKQVAAIAVEYDIAIEDELAGIVRDLTGDDAVMLEYVDEG